MIYFNDALEEIVVVAADRQYMSVLLQCFGVLSQDASTCRRLLDQLSYCHHISLASYGIIRALMSVHTYSAAVSLSEAIINNFYRTASHCFVFIRNSSCYLCQR